MSKLTKIDSNVTGLRVAREASIGVLPASPVWHPVEPNEYSDFGGEITTVARNPINPSRQRKKGVVTDMDASAGYGTDLTQTNMQDLLEGFFFAALRRKPELKVHGAGVGSITDTSKYNLVGNIGAVTAAVAAGGTGHAVGDIIPLSGGTAVEHATLIVTSVAAGVIDGVDVLTAGRYTVVPSDPVAQGTSSGAGINATFNMTWANHADYADGMLILASGFDDPANNGLKRITDVTGQVITVAETLVDEAGPIAPGVNDLVNVGFQAAGDDLTVDVSGTFPVLGSTVLDFTDLGLTPGEWIYIGGDSAETNFTDDGNRGFVRVRSIAATELVLDKTQFEMSDEVLAGGETVRLFFGRVMKNELGDLIRRSTYQFERTLGTPDPDEPTHVQAQYIVGNVANELTLNIPTADKVTADLGFIAMRSETIDGPTALKTGTRPAITEADAFNTSSDIKRAKLALVQDNAAPEPLFAFMQNLTISVNNNATPNKAVGVLGAFEVSAGTFEVGGNISAYFADVEAVAAVTENRSVTLDVHIAKANAGISLDLPLITLGDGRPEVAQDEPIMLPLNMMASSGALVHPDMDYTALMVFWDYLPDAAM